MYRIVINFEVVYIFCVKQPTSKQAPHQFINIRMPKSVKAEFEAKCEEMGSNVSVEIRRFIYEFLKNK